MSELLKCKNCGASVNLSGAIGGVVECEFCFSKWTLPKKGASPAALSFIRQGEHDLDTCRFDDAYAAFYKAWENDSEEPEAYWGLALAEFKIQYIKDTVNNRLQPVCHTVTAKNFTDNQNYKNALLIATPQQRAEYEKKAKEIDYIRSEFFKLEKSGLNYDTFICVKVTGENGEKTEDSNDADYIYNLLRDNGYKPFFSERDIRNRTGADYEAMILYALFKAETMLVICRDQSYLNTPWVKNEYTRFLKMVNDEEKESDSISIVYYETPVQTLPSKNGKIQGIDFSKREADGKILKFVEEHTPQARAKREAQARAKQAEAEEIRKQIEKQKQAQRELEEKLNSIKTVASQTSAARATVNSLLTRAQQELEARDFIKASKYYETVLESDPENGYAWFGLFLCEINISDIKYVCNKITETADTILKSHNLANAIRYADSELKARIEAMCDQISQWLNSRKSALKANIPEKQQEISNAQTELENIQKQIVKFEAEKKKNAHKENKIFNISLFVGIAVALALSVTFAIIFRQVEMFFASLLTTLVIGAVVFFVLWFILEKKAIKRPSYQEKKVAAEINLSYSTLSHNIKRWQENLDKMLAELSQIENWISKFEKMASLF